MLYKIFKWHIKMFDCFLCAKILKSSATVIVQKKRSWNSACSQRRSKTWAPWKNTYDRRTNPCMLKKVWIFTAIFSIFWQPHVISKIITTVGETNCKEKVNKRFFYRYAPISEGWKKCPKFCFLAISFSSRSCSIQLNACNCNLME